MIEAEILNTYEKRELSKRKKIEMSRFYSGLKKNSRETFGKCILCEKENVKLCTSHSLPAFILRGIASDGKILTGHNFLSKSWRSKPGINNTLTFSCICPKCDKEFFSDYEDVAFVKGITTNKTINEIAVKNLLRFIYKRTDNKRDWEEMNKQYPDDAFIKNQLFLSEIDVADSKKDLKRLLKRIDDKNFYIIDEIRLDYSTQMAFQSSITISKGFDGFVNDIYDYKNSDKVEQLHICVFPTEGQTKIILFCNDGSTKMKRFYKHYRTLDLETKLYVINYLILLYNEEWCVSGSFDKKILNKETNLLINQMNEIFYSGESMSEIENQRSELQKKFCDECFTIKEKGNIYNFLKKQ